MGTDPPQVSNLTDGIVACEAALGPLARARDDHLATADSLMATTSAAKQFLLELRGKLQGLCHSPVPAIDGEVNTLEDAMWAVQTAYAHLETTIDRERKAFAGLESSAAETRDATEKLD